jgi:hypothetical protein
MGMIISMVPPPADVQWQGAAAAEQYGPPADVNFRVTGGDVTFRGAGGVEQYGPTVAEFLLKLGGTPQEHLMEELGMAIESSGENLDVPGSVLMGLGTTGTRPMEDIIRDILNQN